MIQMSLKKHSLYNSNRSCFEQQSLLRIANTCITMLCCVTAICLCKIIIKKSVMSESFVFCPARSETRSSTRFSIGCS